MQKASKSGREKVGLTTVEVFLQMCCLSTSIFERPRLFLCLQHAPITKPIYTQNSEEPLISRDAIVGIEGHLQRATLPSRPVQAGPSMASSYRALSRGRETLQVLGRHGDVVAEGTIDRVGKDHFDVAMHARDEFRRAAVVQGVRVIPFEAILLVRASPMSL